MIVFSLLSLTALATTQNLINVQGKAVNKTTGTLITVGNVSVRIYEGPDNGTAAHSETFTNVITNGTFSVQVGNSTTLNLTYNRVYWLEIDVNGEEVVGNATGASGRRAFMSQGGPDATILIANDTSRNVGINITNPGGIFQVSAGGTTTALFVNGTTGYVGIGTASPNTNLNTVGSVNISGTINGTWNGVPIATNFLNVNGIPQANLTGLTIPAANVSSGQFASGLFTFQNNLTVAQNLTVGNTLWVDSAVRNVGINTTSPSGIFQVNVNGSDVFHINETGNVGIGTTAPNIGASGKALTISGSPDAIVELLGSRTANGDAGGIYFRNAASSNVILSQIRGNRRSADNSGSLTFATALAGSVTTQMIIDENGNVGIGTTAPQSKLEVVGGLNVSTAGGASNLYVNTTSGNVGIGTTGPAQKLDVNGNIALSASINKAGLAANVAGLSRLGINMPNLLGEDDTTKQGAFITFDSRSSQFAAAIYVKQPNSSTETAALGITSVGNVGIGTTAPGSKVAIFPGSLSGTPGDKSQSGLSIRGGGLTNELSLISLGFYNTGTPDTNQPAYIGYITTDQAGSTKGALIFGTRNVTTDTAPTERVRIDAAGNVGIGTTSPTALLQVKGRTYTGDASQNTLGQTAMFDIISGSNANAFQVWDDNDLVTPKFIVKRAGNVGIGTTNPGAKLDVNGTINGDEYTGTASLNTARYTLSGSMPDPGGASQTLFRMNFTQGYTAYIDAIIFMEDANSIFSDYLRSGSHVEMLLAKVGSNQGTAVSTNITSFNVGAWVQDLAIPAFSLNQISNNGTHAVYELNVSGINNAGTNSVPVRGLIKVMQIGGTSNIIFDERNSLVVGRL